MTLLKLSGVILLLPFLGVLVASSSGVFRDRADRAEARDWLGVARGDRAESREVALVSCRLRLLFLLGVGGPGLL